MKEKTRRKRKLIRKQRTKTGKRKTNRTNKQKVISSGLTRRYDFFCVYFAAFLSK